MLRMTENKELLRTIEKISVYLNRPHRSRQQLGLIIDELTA